MAAHTTASYFTMLLKKIVDGTAEPCVHEALQKMQRFLNDADIADITDKITSNEIEVIRQANPDLGATLKEWMDNKTN